MTAAELANHDGRDGRSAYIAVNGTIYDVSDSPRWQNGLHPPDHQAGRDLTDELAEAPHVKAVIERFPVIGTLEEAPSPETKGSGKLIFGLVIAVIIAIVIFALL
jgi:predicted heme/steroid binding protein